MAPTDASGDPILLTPTEIQVSPTTQLLAQWEAGDLSEQALSYLLAMRFWDLVESGKLQFWQSPNGD